MGRFCAMVLAAAALAGCASGGYSGYDSYPDEAYYDGPYDPYYGGGFGSYYDDDFDRYYHPSRNVSCDRVRDICYDRFGPSYYATARYLGESEANRAYKKYGDSVFLFSPRPGVSCDRRTEECSDGEWTDRTAPDPLKRLERGNMGSVGSGSGFDDDDAPVRRVAPAQRTDDEAAPTKRIKPQAAPPPMADNDNDVARPTRRVQSEQPKALPRLNSNDKVRDGGAGNACPPQGCRN